MSARVEPGTFNCLWFLDDATPVRGEVTLEPGRPPTASAVWSVTKPEEVHFDDGHIELHSSYPQEEVREEVRGRLDTGQEIVLITARLHTWYADRTSIEAAAAIIGTDLPEESNFLFESAEIQITALDAIGGVAPLMAGSAASSASHPREWTVKQNGAASQSWSSDRATLNLYYSSRASAFDPYQFSVEHTPVLNIKLEAPISLRTWIDDWCTPLQRVIGAATGRYERITHIALRQNNDSWWAVVFGSGITQSPYVSQRSEVGKLNPAFTTYGDNISLLELIQGWRQQQRDGNPLIDAYNPAVLTPEQHPRSRLLLLLQVLEAVYGFENKEALVESAERHSEKRIALIDKLKELSTQEILEDSEFQFLKKNISKYPAQGLDQALRAHFRSLPTRDIITELSGLGVIREASADQSDKSPENALRIIRNNLSHGQVIYPVEDMNRLARLLDRVTRAVFLRILGCQPDVIKRVAEKRRA
ncbi:hypothetical protein AB0J48_26570 [Nocardia salmonicida]|uniref:ApeA N-terminal domain 1-containing protein n=1 Tax=Nocardia salmonicida TaxID=53431 RepID=UPI003414DD89